MLFRSVLGMFLLFWSLDAQGHGSLTFREMVKWAPSIANMNLWGYSVVTLATLFLFVGATDLLSLSSGEVETASREIAQAIEQIARGAVEQTENAGQIRDEVGQVQSSAEHVTEQANQQVQALMAAIQRSRDTAEVSRGATEAATTGMASVEQKIGRAHV